MKELIVYFSHGGKTKKLAEELAAERDADLCEVRYQKPLSTVGAFAQCPTAIAQKPAKNVAPFSINFTNYSTIVIMSSVWASLPAPPINNVIELLPSGTEVELRMVSSSGKSAKENIVRKVQKQGAVVTSYVDVCGRSSQ